MLTITKKATALLKAAKAAEGAADGAGIRIQRGGMPDQSGRLAIGFMIADNPRPEDEQFEQDGLRFFVEDTLIEPLDGRALDVREADSGPVFFFR